MKKINESKAFDKKCQEEFYDSSKDLHAYNIDYLMQNEKEALRLHLDNLVLTYGVQAVRQAMEATPLEVVKQGKKAA